jgi:hypothetical protein
MWYANSVLSFCQFCLLWRNKTKFKNETNKNVKLLFKWLDVAKIIVHLFKMRKLIGLINLNLLSKMFL